MQLINVFYDNIVWKIYDVQYCVTLLGSYKDCKNNEVFH